MNLRSPAPPPRTRSKRRRSSLNRWRALGRPTGQEGDRGAAEDRECRRLRLAWLAYHEPPRALVRGLSLLLAAAPALSACGNGGFRPLYGTTASGAGLQERLAQVDFAPIPGRVGQRIRNELIFHSTGGGNPLPPTHRLEVSIKELVLSTLVRIRRRGARADLRHSGLLPADRHQEQGQEGGAAGLPATPAPVSSASSRSTPTCGHARTPRTAPRAPSPTISRRGLRPIFPARLKQQVTGLRPRQRDLTCRRPVAAGMTHGRCQDPSGRRLSDRPRSPAAGRAALWQRCRPGGGAGGPAGQASGRARRSAGRNPPARRRRASRTTPTASSSSCKTAPMFGGRKIVRATAGRRITAAS